jgi:hypothetical protein
VGDFNVPPTGELGPRIIQENLRAQARILWRGVGEPRTAINRILTAGESSSWREDVPSGESQEAQAQEALLYGRLFANIADRTANIIEMK